MGELLGVDDAAIVGTACGSSNHGLYSLPKAGQR
jgi:hypothetical protein